MLFLYLIQFDSDVVSPITQDTHQNIYIYIYIYIVSLYFNTLFTSVN